MIVWTGWGYSLEKSSRSGIVSGSEQLPSQGCKLSRSGSERGQAADGHGERPGRPRAPILVPRPAASFYTLILRRVQPWRGKEQRPSTACSIRTPYHHSRGLDSPHRSCPRSAHRSTPHLSPVFLPLSERDRRDACRYGLRGPACVSIRPQDSSAPRRKHGRPGVQPFDPTCSLWGLILVPLRVSYRRCISCSSPLRGTVSSTSSSMRRSGISVKR